MNDKDREAGPFSRRLNGIVTISAYVIVLVYLTWYLTRGETSVWNWRQTPQPQETNDDFIEDVEKYMGLISDANGAPTLAVWQGALVNDSVHLGFNPRWLEIYNLGSPDSSHETGDGDMMWDYDNKVRSSATGELQTLRLYIRDHGKVYKVSAF
jgi:hypothetical protein